MESVLRKPLDDSAWWPIPLQNLLKTHPFLVSARGLIFNGDQQICLTCAVYLKVLSADGLPVISESQITPRLELQVLACH